MTLKEKNCFKFIRNKYTKYNSRILIIYILQYFNIVILMLTILSLFFLIYYANIKNNCEIYNHVQICSTYIEILEQYTSESLLKLQQINM